MGFDVPAGAYETFMGQYSNPLGVLFAEWVGIRRGQRAIDVGCGTGALTAELVRTLGADAVAAVDPSPSFVAEIQRRFPGVDAAIASAERLPHPDNRFDAACAQLVVHFMTDAVAGIREMARVTNPGGTVAACVWDTGGLGPHVIFWGVVGSLDDHPPGPAAFAGAVSVDLPGLFDEAGLADITSSSLTVVRQFRSFDEWWRPLTLGVGPVGDYLQGINHEARAELRARCAEQFPSSPFDVSALARCARGTAFE
jgi:SAM-dependent methyltransferase